MRKTTRHPPPSLFDKCPPEVEHAARYVSDDLVRAGIPHALFGGLGVCAHGAPRKVGDVDFLIPSDYMGMVARCLFASTDIYTVTLSLFGDKVRVDVKRPRPDELFLDTEVAAPGTRPPLQDGFPILPLRALVYLKLRENRPKDHQDIVNMLMVDGVDLAALELYIVQHAPRLQRRYVRLVKAAAMVSDGMELELALEEGGAL